MMMMMMMQCDPAKRKEKKKEKEGALEGKQYFPLVHTQAVSHTLTRYGTKKERKKADLLTALKFSN